MTDVYIDRQSDLRHSLVKARTVSGPVEDDLRVFSGILVAVAASTLLWTVIAVLAYAAYQIL